jgi:hypothetical protein
MSEMNRRTFLAGLSAASAFTIVPRRVLGGTGYIPPSDMLRIAQVGCGMQAQRQVNAGMVRRPDLQFVAVVDPNRDSQNYVDWSPSGTRNTIRRFLEQPDWGAGNKGIRGGREVARGIMEAYYKKHDRPGGIRMYEDFREMLEKETDIQGVVNITPDHQHGPVNIAALRKGKAAISHKPVASVLYEVRRTLDAARASRAPSHLLAYSNNPDRHTLAAWINAGAIGTVREVHNWTNRPFWPQGMQEYHKSGPPVPEGFNWQLWQGPEPDRPYHPSYTFAVYRGWYAYGTGCLGDMGHYSLWQPYRILNLGVPVFVEARPSNDAFVDEATNVSKGGRVSQVALPKASTVRWRHPATDSRPSVDTFWYDGGMKPQTPEELYDDNEDLADEGMLIVGDQGKILCDFRGNSPRLLPKKRQLAFDGSVTVPEFDRTSPEDEWVNAIRGERKSQGSFEQVGALAEAVTLACIALRVPYKRLLWDAQTMTFTNSPEATKLVRREAYRPGWDTLIG